MKKTLLFILLTYTLIYSQTHDTLQHKLKDVVVESLHQPILFSDVNRSIDIVDSTKLSSSSVVSPQEILNYLGSVELNKRGQNGVQADVGIRGGSFEQTLIMLDGIKIIDPQTGHHNLSLPVSLSNLDRVEIVKGGSSSIHGANAFSGVVNFRTKRNNKNSLDASLEGGEYGLFSGSLFGSYNLGNLSNNFTFEKSRSDGYRENTEYDITNISYGAALTGKNSLIDFYLGYSDKDFGANSFYTNMFPLQAEHTKTTFAKLSAEFGTDSFNYSIKGYWRNNDDEFLLDKTDPDFYKNNHLTNIFGGELNLYLTSFLGKTNIGGEFVYDKIESSNLGGHNRDRKGIYIEHHFKKFSNLSFAVSGFIYNYSSIGWKMWPALVLGYKITESLKLFTNIGKGFRIPTYTELFYNDRITKSNPNLTYEETLNYELGMNYISSMVNFSTSIFRREGNNLIDWVRTSEDDPWEAMNITSLNTNGVEFSVSTNLQKLLIGQPFNFVRFQYAYLNSNKIESEFESKYLLKYLKHQTILTIGHAFFAKINFNWFLRYEDRINVNDHFIADVKVDRSFSNFNIYVKATNIFNTPYYDIAGVILPGRWIVGGIKFSIE
ncbi:MAG: TonB-dependent receptor [Bacteroidota bacterium]